MKNLILSFFLLTIIFSSNVLGQEKNKEHLEKSGDSYIPNEFNRMKTSPPKGLFKIKNRSSSSSSITTYQVNVNNAGLNIVGDAANEPSIAINPINPSQMVIGWRQFDNITSNFRQAGWAYSSDAGQTWAFPGSIEPGVFRSDPVLDCDLSGNFYYNSLTIDSANTFLCKIFKSTDGGVTWDTGVDAGGGDKEWMIIDKTSGPGNGNIYSTWSQFSSSCAPGSFTRSTTAGTSFENCTEVLNQPQLGTMVVGNSGEVYICGQNVISGSGVNVTKSINAQLSGSLISWDTIVAVSLDGDIRSGGINPVGLIGQANIDVDRSNGVGQDNVYLLATVVRISNSDPGDAMFVKSTDGGLTWGAPVKLNDDTSISNTQWLGALSVAPNGRIDIVWLDTRDNPGSDSSALYYTYSNDQGTTWSINEKVSDSFDPHIGYPNQDKMGDYFHLISDNTGAHLAWVNTLNGEQDIYYSHITPQVATGVSTLKNEINFSISPNPVTSGHISIKCDFKISLFEVLSIQGEKIISSSVNTSTKNLDISVLPNGIYILKVFTPEGQTAVKKLIKQ